MQHFSEPVDEWPVQPLAERYFDRPWYCEEIGHDPRVQANYYQNLIIRPQTLDPSLPSVWHVAWRHPLPRAKWQLLGFVRREADRFVLFNGWAITDSAAAAPQDPALCVQAWFGRCPAAFRVASLHPFSVATAKTPHSDLPNVRFAMPGEPGSKPVPADAGGRAATHEDARRDQV
jgi:hypothetical protein